MTRKPVKRANRAARRKPAKKTIRPRPAARPGKADPLDAFVAAAARALELPLQPAWLPAIRGNLRVTLQHAETVAEFELPDSAEPAPVFRA